MIVMVLLMTVMVTSMMTMVMVSPFLLYFLPIASTQRRHYYVQNQICGNPPSSSYQNKTFYIFDRILSAKLPINCFHSPFPQRVPFPLSNLCFSSRMFLLIFRSIFCNPVFCTILCNLVVRYFAAIEIINLPIYVRCGFFAGFFNGFYPQNPVVFWVLPGCLNPE